MVCEPHIKPNSSVIRNPDIHHWMLQGRQAFITRYCKQNNNNNNNILGYNIRKVDDVRICYYMSQKEINRKLEDDEEEVGSYLII
jgi:hypothetical protein